MSEQTPAEMDLEAELGGAIAPSEGQLSELETLVRGAVALEGQIDAFTQQLSTLKEELQTVTHTLIPGAMSSAGVEEFTTTAGVKVSLKEFVRGSLPRDEDKRHNAMLWLEQHGASDLFKHLIKCEFARGDKDTVNAIHDQLVELGVTFDQKEDVHPQTLYAYVRERMRNGEEVPLDLLGLHAGRMAKVKVPTGG